jgi:hypothetical protein
MRASKSGSERQDGRRCQFVPRADEQGVEPTGPNELTEFLAGSVGDDHLFEVDSRRAQEHVGVAQQALGGGGALGPRSRLVFDRDHERHAQGFVPCVLATEPHQPVRIDVRVRRHERAGHVGWARVLLEVHDDLRSIAVTGVSAIALGLLTGLVALSEL